MFIRSQRLLLRPGWPEDWTELFAARACEGRKVDAAYGAMLNPMADAIAFARRPQAKLLPHFLVTLPGGDGSRIVGCIGFADEDGEAELGVWIAQAHRRQGYATEAVRAVLGLAEVLGHRRVVARCSSDHAASGRVLARSGFRRAGDKCRAIEFGATCDQGGNGMMRAA